MKNISKNGLILAGFALVSTALISITQIVTAPVIKQQQNQQLRGILDAILSPKLYDNDLLHDCIVVNNNQDLGPGSHTIYRASKQGQPVAVAIESVAPDGYNGRIELVVSIIGEHQVGGVRVLNHQETPGLGDKIDLRVSDWILGFHDKKYEKGLEQQWAVKKDGGQFDQFTGATITPRAVVKAVRNTVQYYQQHQAEIIAASNQCGSAS
ncbi:electron transport complex subunit RsxG [Neptunicella marina]|uniref:Ion-translocating oxidoreductase complex subunit G n=1 Tax=Neptunicella marina TaxID=2125989 RepID=A0A8J6IUY2_9ALTE|nr:electron transport complex subunit RsxG [Neptunicella marina]MBC3766814.1 electron transport complex subunit RsxG [Neptunicella marina]